MRNKKSKLLSLSILALCVACLSFGVFALKNATLTVNGTIGFNAHDCLVSVVAFIEGDGVVNGTPDANGAPSAKRDLVIDETNNDNNLNIGGSTKAEWEQIANVGQIYFTDLTNDGIPETITLTFEVTNNSDFKIYARIANDAITGVSTGATTTDLVLDEGAKGELKATFILNPNAATGEYEDIVGSLPFNVELDFGKYVEGATGGDEGGEEINPTYMTNIPQTVSDIMTMFEGSEFTPEEQEVGSDTDPDGLIGGVKSTKGETSYTYLVFESPDAAVAYRNSDECQEVVNAVGEDNVVVDGSVIAMFSTGSIGGGGEVEGGETQVTQLAQPKGSVSEDILTVTPVENASGYRATLVLSESEVRYATDVVMDENGTYRLNIKTFLTQSGAVNGVYIINLQAIGDEVNYTTSGYAYGGEYTFTAEESGELTQLETPTNARISNDILTFDSVLNARQYEIEIENRDTGATQKITVSTTQVDLSTYFGESGYYAVAVKALGNGVAYSDSESVHLDIYQYTKPAGQLTQLSTPVVTDVYDTYFKFGTVSNASGYIVEYESDKGDKGQIELGLRESSCDLTKYIKNAGEYAVSIYALGDGKTYSNSEVVQVGTFALPDTAPDPVKLVVQPPVLVKENNTIVIYRVEGAVNYVIDFVTQVTYNQVAVTTVEQFEEESKTITLNMPETAGEYLLRVKAYGDGTNYTDSDYNGLGWMVIDNNGNFAAPYVAPASVSIVDGNILVELQDVENLPVKLQIAFKDNISNGSYGIATVNLSEFTQDAANTALYSYDLKSAIEKTYAGGWSVGMEYYVEVRCAFSDTNDASEYTRSSNTFTYTSDLETE